jgi:CARDB
LFGVVHMRRASVTGILVAALAAVAPAGAVGSVGPVPKPDKPPLAATLTGCQPAADAAQRTATFTASMPALAGTRRLQMRFTLLQRRGTAAGYKRIDVPGWNAWERSDPGRPGFILTERVESLYAPAAYKAVVVFRWYDKRGHLQRQTSRVTGVCAQPDPRADLALDFFSAARSGRDQAVYSLVVRNAGLADAEAFAVALTIGGTDTAPIALGPIASGETAQGTVVGPACAPGTTVTIRLDPADAIDEVDETNNVVDRPCPL